MQINLDSMRTGIHNCLLASKNKIEFSDGFML